MTKAGQLDPKRCEAATAFYELVLRPASGVTEVKSRQDIWKGPTWIRAGFCTGEAAEATRWTLEEMYGCEACFPAYDKRGEHSAAVVKFTTSVADLLLCPVQPSLAVTSQRLGTVHAVWLLSSQVRKPVGASLADALARRLGGKGTPLIPVPGTADYGLARTDGGEYEFEALQAAVRAMPTRRAAGVQEDRVTA